MSREMDKTDALLAASRRQCAARDANGRHSAADPVSLKAGRAATSTLTRDRLVELGLVSPAGPAAQATAPRTVPPRLQPAVATAGARVAIHCMACGGDAGAKPRIRRGRVLCRGCA
jgi:hypothetical protein